MNISTRQLDAFLALAAQQNFTRAAAQCHLSQPAFSALIKGLEADLGLRLFDRSTRHVSLTAEGEGFLGSAERIRAEMATAMAQVRDAVSLRRGRVSVALLPSLAAGWLPQWLAQFQAQHPDVTLDIADVLSEPCIARVASGQADFALAAIRADTPALQAEPFCSDRFHLVCRADHPLAQPPHRTPLALDSLAPWPFIHLARHSSVRQYLEAAFHPQTMHTVMELEQLSTVVGMVRAGLGITVVPTLTLFHFQDPQLVTRPLPLPGLERDIYLVRRRDRSLSLAAQALYALLMQNRPPLTSA